MEFTEEILLNLQKKRWWGTGTSGPEKLWLSLHPWKCPRLDWMGHGTTWDSGRGLELDHLQVPSNPKQSLILKHDDKDKKARESADRDFLFNSAGASASSATLWRVCLAKGEENVPLSHLLVSLGSRTEGQHGQWTWGNCWQSWECPPFSLHPASWGVFVVLSLNKV